MEEKEGDYVPPERLGQRQPENDIEEEETTNGGTSAIDLVENNAYLNTNVKRKRLDNEQPAPPPTTTTKEDRVRSDSISDNLDEIFLETSNAC